MKLLCFLDLPHIYKVKISIIPCHINEFIRSSDVVTHLYKEKRQPLLLAIDEAQYLNTGILNDLKMLMNYGYDSVNHFTLILCGESHLNDTLRKPVHEALRQRITVHYNYTGLTDDEVSDYIRHKLSHWRPA